MIVTNADKLTEALEALSIAEADRVSAVERRDTCRAFDLIDEVYRIEVECVRLFTGNDRRWNPAWCELRRRLLQSHKPEA